MSIELFSIAAAHALAPVAVGISSVLRRLLEAYLPTLTDRRLFPWWDGETLEETYLDGVSNRLSQTFARRFAARR